MNIKYVCAGLAFMALPIFTSAQSDPTPFNLGISGNYAFTNWPAISPGGTYPSGMIFHQMDAALPSLTSTAASDLGAGFSYLNLTGTRIQGVGSRGIELQNTQSPLNTGFLKNRLGEIVLGVVTTGRTQLQLSWKAQTRTNGGNITAIRCQYRIGTSGSYSDFPAVSEYMSSNIPLDSAVKT
ncbi:MAG TPA: hypothetical protein VI731_06715, partial [Bacteroidia bacterium]|nr:hypothetical protein [Bacteroidia bacterium]